MDEPFGALDPLTRAELHAEFRRIQSALRKTVIIVTHDMGEAFALGDRVGVLDEGRLVACDRPDGDRGVARSARAPAARRAAGDSATSAVGLKRADASMISRLFAFWLVAPRGARERCSASTCCSWRRRRSSPSAIGVPLGIFAARRPRLASPLMAARQHRADDAEPGDVRLPAAGAARRRRRRARRARRADPLRRCCRSCGRRSPACAASIASIREAGVAMGMTPRELLRQVELPLALPSIVAGVRVAAVVGVGSATIAAAIGAGGLGEYIYRGLSMVDTTVILAGAIPAAVLALVGRRRAAVARASAVGAPPIALAARAAAAAAVARRRSCCCRAASRRGATRGAIVVGSKNFTEQLVLGELLAQTIERDAGVPVDRRLNLGGTLICDRALLSGDIDVYVEYTGTALTAVFHQPVEQRSAARVRHGARAVRADRPDAAAAARLQQHLRDSGPRRGRARARAARRSTTRRARRRGGAPGSATSSSSGPTAIPGWRRRTGCASRSRRA